MTEAAPKGEPELTSGQKEALAMLQSDDNVFLTGPAGTGKSFVVKKYLSSCEEPPPILASTGAAAILVGGRTFHSFFGLGILEGGRASTLERFSKNLKARARVRAVDQIIIDEISMISEEAFEVASEAAKIAKGSSLPFGGIRLILSGDFLQLPPVVKGSTLIHWLFDTRLWQSLNLRVANLSEPKRTDDIEFIKVLHKVRFGIVDRDVTHFLNSKISPLDPNFEGTVLFGLRKDVEAFNQKRLERLPGKEQIFKTSIHIPSDRSMTPERALKISPLPSELFLKKGALVMIRKNDGDAGRYANGSLGHIKDIRDNALTITLFSGDEVSIEKHKFEILDGDGKTIASVTNFPVNLGYASTIHKCQGASIDSLYVDLDDIWEMGQAYVALSRAKDPSRLAISGWKPSCILADKKVVDYYLDMED